jgi:two-component system OmpR family sensor kinase
MTGSPDSTESASLGMPRSRPRRPRWSVRVRILTSMLLVAALGLGGAGVTTYRVQRNRTLQDIDDRLTSRVESARVVATSRPGYATTSAALEAIIATVIPNTNESSLGILDGKVAFIPGVSTTLTIDRSPGFAAQVTREVAGGSVWLGTREFSVGRVRYIAAPITVTATAKGATPQTGIYVAAVNLDAELSAGPGQFGATYAVVALIALLAIGLVGWFVAGRLLRPIRQLRSTASRITASDRRERIPVVGQDDVSDLTRTINDMLDRLDGAITSQNQLLDDVRHELKTPITILRGHLELLDVTDASEVRTTRALALDELDRMAGLVDDIEALAETQRDTMTLVPTDVADLTSDVFAKVSVFPGHEWMLAGTAHLSVELDAARITQAWVQLADNAAKYSAEGTAIELGSRSIVDEDGGDAVEFWVKDVGGGIPSDSWDRIFERFGRVDTGRGIRGSGLGLPIVKAIAVAHGGRISLESSPRGSRFGIVVPVQNYGEDVVFDEGETP